LLIELSSIFGSWLSKALLAYEFSKVPLKSITNDENGGKISNLEIRDMIARLVRVSMLELRSRLIIIRLELTSISDDKLDCTEPETKN
jgi:hypothetical protein